ncbi:MBL fold metallo-hydrolase [Rhizobium sp. BK379]|uniref:MBL fold metallo-hydrolase n=1 Tax=Rhizobium sp. BK379 TaxID=2587059 RepID=UPI00161AD41B|nr:MBL fold metallo-hydrolase [Rhizobium sp. BK379]MBB3444139.1 glyoxylase-like metal-dependent hydrolase (beta-lactamase superfamily II) [Rhizobium sp. BK379]
MTVQLPLEDSDLAPTTETGSGISAILPDLAFRRMSIVNVIFYGDPATDADWVLIDTGLPTSRQAIIEAAEHRFGVMRPPSAILLTHGHFDHVGSLETLAQHWNVPVYAHWLEFPYLNGQASYPPADPLVGGGAMALLSPLYPRSPVNVEQRLQPLPQDRSVPFMPGWTWLHTPGHAPGHVSLWRAADRCLIAGDAIVTTGQESVYEVMTQRPEMHGPPRYLTPDWDAAQRSVVELAELKPELVITGHGQPVRGANMRARLQQLADNFKEIAVPEGRPYALDPAKPGKRGNDTYR